MWADIIIVIILYPTSTQAIYLEFAHQKTMLVFLKYINANTKIQGQSDPAMNEAIAYGVQYSKHLQNVFSIYVPCTCIHMYICPICSILGGKITLKMNVPYYIVLSLWFTLKSLPKMVYLKSFQTSCYCRLRFSSHICSVPHNIIVKLFLVIFEIEMFSYISVTYFLHCLLTPLCNIRIFTYCVSMSPPSHLPISVSCSFALPRQGWFDNIYITFNRHS